MKLNFSGATNIPLIMVIGKTGQVGWELTRTLPPLGKLISFAESEFDLRDVDAIKKAINDNKPDVIINAAAYTAVDKAESEPDLARLINADAPAVIAEQAKKNDALLVHYSTDYVFDGNKPGFYREDDAPGPLGVYGKTKLAGDHAIISVGGNYLILRTSWVYAMRGNNFLLTMLKLMRERKELSIVNDQIGAPTWARLIAQVTAFMVYKYLDKKILNSGIYNLTSSGHTSWFGFAQKISAHVKNDGIAIEKINPIPSSDYSTPAPRPKNSRLDLGKLEKYYGLVMPSWDVALGYCLDKG